MEVAVVDLRDDGEHRHLEHDRVQPRALDRDVDLARAGDRAHVDEALVELKQAEQVDVIALEEAPAAKVVELAPGESKSAQCRYFLTDLGDVRGELDVRVTALEAVFDLRRREVMQHDLHHRELVQVGVE